MAIENVNQGNLNVSMTPYSNGAIGGIESFVSQMYPFAYEAFGGGADRSPLGQLLNPSAIEKEDWRRNEQSYNNQMYRDLYLQNIANEFNAKEAQKQRDYEERMSNTAYQRAVEDMKKAGLNPVLALGNPASVPSGASASASTARSSGGYRAGGSQNDSAGLIGSFLQYVGGIISVFAK